MKKITKKLTALGLCAALCLGGVCAASAQTGSGKSSAQTMQQTPTVKRLSAAQMMQQNTKDETVYVLSDADGGVQRIIVSDWLKNASGSGTLRDVSDLTDIENVKGDETFTADGSAKVWDAQGNDIYYQGSSEKELPLELAVCYQLDGKSVTASELAGKSGHVTIRFDYRSRLYETVELDGGEETLCVPFAVLTGLVLENDSFRNVTVSSGRVINDGERTLVVGLAFPALQENLALERDTVDLPDYVEISADTDCFSLGMTVTLATNEVFSVLDADKLDVDGLGNSLAELTDAMTQLLDGSDALCDGLSTLREKSGQLTAGIEQLADGAQTVNAGAASLSDGAAQLSGGLTELSAGLSTLSGSSAALQGGAEQVFASLLASATQQLRAAGLAVPDLTADNYAATIDGLIAAAGAAGESAAGTVQTLSALKASLDSYDAFYTGLCAYTDGVDSAAYASMQLTAGAETLQSGAAQLASGTASLQSGALRLKDGAPALNDGVSQLCSGAQELSDGLAQLNEQGIEKLVDLLGDELDTTLARLRASIDVSKSYRSFSGLSDDMDGQVKFIYRTAEIKAEG